MGPAALVTSTREGWISHVLSFPSGWCNTHSKSAQKRLPEVLLAVAAIFQISTVQLTDDDRLMVQQRRKRWLILSNRNKRAESVRTIEELSLEFVPQTFERYFHKFSA